MPSQPDRPDPQVTLERSQGSSEVPGSREQRWKRIDNLQGLQQQVFCSISKDHAALPDDQVPLAGVLVLGEVLLHEIVETQLVSLMQPGNISRRHKIIIKREKRIK